MDTVIRAVDPSRESFKQMFARVPDNTPVQMVNLVRFWKIARDPVGVAQRSGASAYAAYIDLFEPLLAAVKGRIVWTGTGHFTLIAPPGEEWDHVIIVEYPRVDAFGQLIRSEPYKKILPHRLAGVRDTRLVVTTSKNREGTL